MKTIYFIRHAKSKDFQKEESDFERTLSKRGYKDIQTIASYLRLCDAMPHHILSSCALRAQQTATAFAHHLKYNGNIEYLQELYLTSMQDIIDIIHIQDDAIDHLVVIGHHPYLTELVNTLAQEHIAKIPSMGVVSIDFEIHQWQEIGKKKGILDFFIFPKQFKYYMPRQIRTKLNPTD